MPQLAIDLAQGLVSGDGDGAQAIVKRSYDLLFQSIDRREQRVERFYQQLDKIQSQAMGQGGRAKAETRNSGTGVGESGQKTISNQNPVAEQAELFDWLKELFSFAPETAGKSYRELAQLAIDCYYRMPHPDQAVQLAMADTPIPDPLKLLHGVEHVTRTQVLAEALVQLFSRHDSKFQALLEQQPDLRELIPLAMVYHDATAEVEDKTVEETRAAQLFTRDMNRVGRYSSAVVEQVATALRHKESDVQQCTLPQPPSPPQPPPDTPERRICRILRLADRIDIIRATSIPKDWQQPRHSNARSDFNYSLLDLPDSVSGDFRREFNALLEGAKDLAYVTGGIPKSDDSESRSYLQRYDLRADNEQRKQKVTQAENAYDSVRNELDNNVRRALAKAAGIVTCTEDHTKESVQRHGGRLPCLVESNGRDTLTAIHSELELGQVHVPEQMTTEQKLMFEQLYQPGEIGYLPEAISRELERERQRLREHGIHPLLGTLTQEVLASPAAQAQLRFAYQLEVVPERRCGGGDQTFLVPRPTDPGNKSGEPRAKRRHVGSQQ